MTRDEAKALPRAVGTTYKQVEALPSGSVFVVHHPNGRYVARECLRKQGRTIDDLRIVVVECRQDFDQLKGVPRSTKVEGDHWFLKSMSNDMYNLWMECTARFEQ